MRTKLMALAKSLQAQYCPEMEGTDDDDGSGVGSGSDDGENGDDTSGGGNTRQSAAPKKKAKKGGKGTEQGNGAGPMDAFVVRSGAGD